MTEKVTAYYAHPIDTYYTSQEENDLKFISSLFDDFNIEIVNPSDKNVQENFDNWKKTKSPDEHDMRFFKNIIKRCDVLFYRGNTNGVKYEIKKAKELGMETISIE